MSDNEDIINHMLKNIYRIRKNVLKCKECSLKNRILMIASYLPKNIYVSLVKRV